MSTKMPSGYSSKKGKIYVPLVLKTHESSSDSRFYCRGEFAPLANGTALPGSIVAPASLQSVEELYPSLGHVNRTGIIPLYWKVMWQKELFQL
ncbi:hypothetical protein [Paenibacillus alvei]|uniref:hypothetical protein n=1 Tax=Paenibacillus alvei TaxID=44250 RepID=UPI003AF3146B